MTGTARLRWFVAGTSVAVFLVVTQAVALGGLAGLLQVGESSGLRPTIEAELGEIPLVPGGGHDGQISYAIGLDLTMDHLGPAIGDAGYRYRRVLYPALASLFGILDGFALLVGMVLVAVIGFGLATAAVADLAASPGITRWVTLGVLANPGGWLAVRLLTPDALALGLVLTGLALFARRHHGWAALVLALAALAKDQSLIAAAGLVLWLLLSREVRRAIPYAIVPLAALASWSTVVSVRMGDGFTPRGNLGFPFAGILESLPRWSDVPASDAVLAGLMVLIVAAGLWLGVRLRRTWMGIQLLAWSLVAVVSSSWVWDFGNNVARAFAPLIALIVVASTGAHSSSPPDFASR